LLIPISFVEEIRPCPDVLGYSKRLEVCASYGHSNRDWRGIMELWQKQLIRKLFHYSAKHMDIEGAFLAKHPHVPSKLYKYRQFSDSHIDALEKGVLWSSSPDRLNDPYEAAVRFDSDRFLMEDLSPDEFVQVVKGISKKADAGESWEQPAPSRPIRSGDWMARNIKQFLDTTDMAHKAAFVSAMQQFSKDQMTAGVQRMTDLFRQGFSVLSLSATPVSELLWSHYSNSHTGFVVEYDFAALAYGDLRRRLCFPVFYTKKLRDATLYMARRDTANFNNLFGQYMLLMKQASWSYEEEWRIIHAIGPSHANFPILMPKPSAVIFGSQVKLDENVQKVLDYCAGQGISVHRAFQTPGQYGLSIRDGAL
jgi:hypothetical protein